MVFTALGLVLGRLPSIMWCLLVFVLCFFEIWRWSLIYLRYDLQDVLDTGGYVSAFISRELLFADLTSAKCYNDISFSDYTWSTPIHHFRQSVVCGVVQVLPCVPEENPFVIVILKREQQCFGDLQIILQQTSRFLGFRCYCCQFQYRGWMELDKWNGYSGDAVVEYGKDFTSFCEMRDWLKFNFHVDVPHISGVPSMDRRWPEVVHRLCGSQPRKESSHQPICSSALAVSSFLLMAFELYFSLVGP